ncbi:MAG: hypothetical protein F6J93_08415 [Oscillatoria sp. SIO1A7]|nr:hypothetical protein [Oscillatoria sp. SIO1A7]
MPNAGPRERLSAVGAFRCRNYEPAQENRLTATQDSEMCYTIIGGHIAYRTLRKDPLHLMPAHKASMQRSGFLLYEPVLFGSVSVNFVWFGSGYYSATRKSKVSR